MVVIAHHLKEVEEGTNLLGAAEVEPVLQLVALEVVLMKPKNGCGGWRGEFMW